jgi:hypothetical protein
VWATNPLVCVALSVKDGGAFLAEAIESVLAQEDVALELRIYDNGSTDGSFAVYARVADDARVTVVVNPEGSTFYDSMNCALADTSAPWLVPWCADDVMLPRCVADKLDAVERTGASFAFAPAVSIDRDGRRQYVMCADEGDREVVFDAPSFFPRITPWNNVVLSGLLASCDAVRAVGGFERERFLCGDWMLWLRLALRVRGVYVPEPGVLYREHEVSSTSTARRAGAFVAELVSVLRAAYGDPALPPEWRPRLTDDLITVLCGQAANHAEAGLLRSARTTHPAYALLLDALLLDPDRGSTMAAYLAVVRSAGLPETRFPANVVAMPGLTAEDVASTMRAIRALVTAAGLVGRVQIATHPDSMGAMIDLVEHDLERHGDVDIELAVTPDGLTLLHPGDIFVARSGDPNAIKAESIFGATVRLAETGGAIATNVSLRAAA